MPTAISAPTRSTASTSTSASSSASCRSGACSSGASLASTSDQATGQQVPFYLMPTLGGNDSLRGFRDYRFRGPHALLLQGEYRFEIWSGLDGALFYDAGKVAHAPGRSESQQPRVRLRLRIPFQHRQRHHPPRGRAFGSRDGKHLWIVFGGRF